MVCGMGRPHFQFGWHLGLALDGLFALDVVHAGSLPPSHAPVQGVGRESYI